MSQTRMFKVINHNEFALRGRYDGVDYVFEPEKGLNISFDAARHIFGMGNPDKSQALNMLGLLVPGRDTLADALKKLDRVTFLEGKVVYPTTLEELAADEDGDPEPGNAPQTQGPVGSRREASRKPHAANP